MKWFATTYEIDVSAASRELEEYHSIGEFFVRDLREGLRPIEGDLVSPVDGVLRNFDYDSFMSNTARSETTAISEYDPPVPIGVGDRLGTFHMGSSVVVLIEPGRVAVSRVRLEAGQSVRYGEAVMD